MNAVEKTKYISFLGKLDAFGNLLFIEDGAANILAMPLSIKPLRGFFELYYKESEEEPIKKENRLKGSFIIMDLEEVIKLVKKVIVV